MASTAAAPDPEKAKDRRSTFWIGVVCAVVAGLMAGVGSWVATTQQLEGQSEQSQAEFLRTQRQQAYADLIDHVDAFDSTISSVLPNSGQAGAPPLTEAQVLSVQQAADQVRAAASIVFVIAPLETLTDAGRISAAVAREWQYVQYLHCRAAAVSAAQGICTNAPTEGSLEAYLEAEAERDGRRSAFLLDARKDLGVPYEN